MSGRPLRTSGLSRSVEGQPSASQVIRQCRPPAAVILHLQVLSCWHWHL